MIYSDQIVELTLVICVANFTNRFNDAMQLQLDLGVSSRTTAGNTPTALRNSSHQYGLARDSRVGRAIAIER